MSASTTVYLPGAITDRLQSDSDVTFFQSVMSKHTPFAMESARVDFNLSKPVAGSTATATLPRSGDLITDIYLRVDGITGAGPYEDWAFELIESLQLKIGHSTVQTVYGAYMWAWEQLSATDDQEQYSTGWTNEKTSVMLCIPFWFSRSNGAGSGGCLKLISMQYHAVQVEIEWAGSFDFSSCDAGACDLDLSGAEAYLMCDYIYLDNAERTSLASASFEEVIVETQKVTGVTNASGLTTIDCPLNHAVTELIVLTRPTGKTFAQADDALPRFDKLQLKLNNQDRFDKKSHDAAQFHHVYRRVHSGSRESAKGLAVIPFALAPELSVPSGSLNFSRIDSAKLEVVLKQDVVAGEGGAPDVTTNTDVEIFARSHNILKTAMGLSGLLFAS